MIKALRYYGTTIALQENMAQVVSLKSYRELKDNEREELTYRARILCMSKVELLEEMVRFQEERKTIGELTPTLMIQGRHLFSELEKQADTQELKILSRSYRRHLEYELQHMKQNKNSELDQ